MRLVPIALAFSVLLAGAAAAEGCSADVAPATVVVRASDAIARVRVLGAVPGGAPPGRVTVEVLEVLKGRLGGRVLTVAGRLVARAPSAARPSPYDQLDCARAGGCGGCFAYDYILGQEYLFLGQEYLFLLKGGTPYWAPLAPVNEAISGPGDPWVRWVQEELWRW